MKNAFKLTSMILAATALAGCQGSALEGWGFAKKKAGSSFADRANVDGMLALEEGRAFLRQGNISAAVASFRVARMDRSVAADAHNGLGVAYAKLGRPDLADRYFRIAMSIDPSNERYAANLLRMQSRALMASRARSPDVVEAPVERIAEAPTPVMEPRQVAVQTARAKARPPEFHIVTNSELAPAPQMTVAARSPSGADKAKAQAAEKPADTTDEPAEVKVALLDRLRSAPLEVVF